VWPPSALESLRAQVRQIEGQHRRATPSLPFGIAAVDARLPGGALPLGALHEMAGGGNGAIDGAAAALFAAGIAARTRGQVLWCLTRLDLFAPALAQAGLNSTVSSISKAATRRPSWLALKKACGMGASVPLWRRSRA
jgi:protein ImuA